MLELQLQQEMLNIESKYERREQEREKFHASGLLIKLGLNLPEPEPTHHNLTLVLTRK